MTDTYELPEPVGWVVRYPNGDEAVTGWPALGCEKLTTVYTADQVRLAVKAERERLSEPTPEMIAEGWRAAAATQEWTHEAVRYLWRRMVAAAIRKG